METLERRVAVREMGGRTLGATVLEVPISPKMDSAARFSSVDAGAGRHDDVFAPKAMRAGHLEHTDEGFEG